MIFETQTQPRQIRLDTTTTCQAKCLTCHRHMTERKGTMNLDKAKRIIDDIASWKEPLKEIVPVNYGEFFLYPQWAELLDYIQSKLPNTQIVIPTNGAVLTKPAIEKLAGIKTLRIVNFSVNAMFKETYEQFMGLPFETTQKIATHIKRLRELRPDITIWISCVADPIYQTQFEIEVFKAYWASFGQVQILPNVTCGRPDKRVVIHNTQPCRSIFSDMAIGFDGKITCCCFNPGFDLDLGVYTGDAKKDWLNPKLKEFRALHNTGRRQEIELCKECSHA